MAVLSRSLSSQLKNGMAEIIGGLKAMTSRAGVTRRDYFDGLRGWGALFVLFYHTTQMWGGSAPIQSFSLWSNEYLFQWFFADGRFAVYIFFAISGFVLSIGFYEKGRVPDVVSLAVRRYPRLTLPVLFYCTLVVLAGNTFSQFILDRASANAVPITYYLKASPSLLEAVRFATSGVYWGSQDRLTLTPQLWTMPIEMIGSFVIFAILIVCGRDNDRRVIGYLAFIGASFFGGLEMGLGLAAMAMGMALAHISSRPWHIAFEKTFAAQCLGGLALILGLTSAALRDPARDNVLPFCGALVVYAALTLRPFQYAIDRPISRWLGKISFPLYLTHLLILLTVRRGRWRSSTHCPTASGLVG